MVDLPGTLGFSFDCVLCQDFLGQVKEGCLTVGLRTKQEKTVWSEGLGCVGDWGLGFPSPRVLQVLLCLAAPCHTSCIKQLAAVFSLEMSLC